MNAVPHRAVLDPFVAQWLLRQLERAGVTSAKLREQELFLRAQAARPDLADQFVDSLRQLHASAAWHREHLLPASVSDDGNAEVAATETARRSVHEEVTTAEAARMLGLTSSRRVLQLLDGGELLGRRVGRSWLVDRGSVGDLAGVRRTA